MNSEIHQIGQACYKIIYILFALLGVAITIAIFWPGMFTNDSLSLQRQASFDHYNTYQPVLLAWWIHQLSHLYNGTSALLLQNILFYWLAFLLVALTAFRAFRVGSILILFAALFPLTITSLGFIWKDVAYGVSQFLVYAILYFIDGVRKVRWTTRILILVLLIFGIGVKTNGLTVLPITVIYWAHVEGWLTNRFQWPLVPIICLSVTVIAWNVVPKSKIDEVPVIQYIQVNDILAISAESGENYFPDYITKIRSIESSDKLNEYYETKFDGFFWSEPEVITADKSKLSELRKSWLLAIKSRPLLYIKHRAELFLSFITSNLFPKNATIYLANPPGGNFSFPEIQSSFAAVHDSLRGSVTWVFSPLIALAVLMLQICALLNWRSNPMEGRFVLYLNLASWSFIVPHLLIIPANEHRYFYFVYMTSICGFCITILQIVTVKHFRSFGSNRGAEA